MTDIVTILSGAINITGLIEYTGDIITAIIAIFPDVITLLVYVISLAFVAGIIGVIFGFISSILDINKLMGKFKLKK